MKTSFRETSEKIVLTILAAYSLLKFTESGSQTIYQILGKILNVSLAKITLLDPIISILTTLGSVLILVGSLFWWKQKKSAVFLLLTGYIFFIFQNVFSILNEILLVKESTTIITEKHLSTLTDLTTVDFFFIALWVLLFGYFLKRKPFFEKKGEALNALEK